MDAFLPPLLEALPGRVAFVGIQGSFGRGEAGPESDVDLVVVLD
ncbi:nucleotidyltransferase domain-containing protein, partial [Flavonifractor plautii]